MEKNLDNAMDRDNTSSLSRPTRKMTMTNRLPRRRRHRWCAMAIALSLLCLYGGNLVRLHHHLPSLEELHAHPAAAARVPRRRRVEQDNGEAQAALWARLETQLVQRQGRCNLSFSNSSNTNATIPTSQSGHLRGVLKNQGQSANLLTALREYRQEQAGKQNLFHCNVPSSCPVQEEAKVATVLVIGKQQNINWRYVLVDAFKILAAVDELWILVAQRVWTLDNDSNKLYKERFRKWQQANDDSRIRLLVVEEEGAWMKAIEQLDSESAASTLIWAEVRDSNDMKPPTAAVSWQNFTSERVQAWRSMPFPLHVSFWLDTVGAARSLASMQSANWCHDSQESQHNSAIRLAPGTMYNGTISGLPSIHGLVHDRSWLCFWKHPIMHRFLQGTESWQITSIGTTLWMAHLAGVEFLNTTNETVDVGIDDDVTDREKIAELVNFFGGIGLPTSNATTLPQECDT